MEFLDLIMCAIAPKIIINSLKKQNPARLGMIAADFLDETLDSEFGNKKSAQVHKVIVPFMNKFVMSFNKTLLEDCKPKKK